MLASPQQVLAVGRSRHVASRLIGSLALGVGAGAASVGLLALSGWFIAMSALAGAGLAAGFSFFYPSAGVQALAFGRTVLRYVERLVGHAAALQLDAALKESVFAVALESGSAGSARTSTGRLVHAVTSDAEIAEGSLLRVVAPVVTYVGVLIGGTCVIAATVSMRLAGIIGLGGVAVAFVAVLPAWSSSLAPGKRLAEAETAAWHEVVDALDGLDELAAFGAEVLAAQRIERSFGAVAVSQAKLRRLAAATKAMGVTLVGATVLLVAAVASGAIGRQPVAVASSVAVTLAALGILQLSDPLATAAQEVGKTKAVWQRLSEMLRVAEPPTVDEFHTGSAPGSVELVDITVDRGRGVIIDQLRLRASPGQTVLVTGPSGAGKSSLLGALACTIPVQSGQVRLAGKVVSLPQHPYVFRGTVADNLRLANPAASHEEMQELLVMVGLDDVLGPDALEQRIGSGARALSGGQVRRLSVAQALLARPNILLADEPTEGLDESAARELLLGVRLFDPWMTLILVLHAQQLNQLSWTPDSRVHLEARTHPAMDEATRFVS